MALMPLIVRSKAGIKRDGTIFEGDYYVDGQWVRFQRSLPRKIGGYVTTNRFLPEICRGVKTYTVGNYTYIFTGGAGQLQYHTLDLSGNSSILVNRTPSTIQSNVYNIWQFEIIVDTTQVPPVNQIVAHVSPNAQSLSNTTGGQIFIGDLIAETPLVEFTSAVTEEFVQPTGGIVALHPYLVVYGNDGTLAWSAPGRPRIFYTNEYLVTTFVTAQPIYVGQSNFFITNNVTDLDNNSILFQDTVNPPYLTGTGSTGTFTVMTLSVPLARTYSQAQALIYIATNTTLTTQSGITTGGTSFTVLGNVVGSFPTGRAICFFSATNRIYYVSTATLNAGVVTVVITGVFAEGYSANTPIFSFISTSFNAYDLVSQGQTAIMLANDRTALFISNAQITFNNDSTSYTVSNSVTRTLRAIPILGSTFQATYPTNTAIFKEGTSATGAGNARVASQKLVKGLPLRGGPGNSPSAIFWSTDAVLRMSFVGGELIFQFDTISAQSSILSANSVIEHDGIYYWVGTDRFLTFNGVVRELKNDMSINWFFDNINRSASQRVFAFKVPRYAEIWWCFPYGNATECTHAVIYNIREDTWYDTELPNGGRSAGEFIALFGAPIMTGIAPYVIDANLDVNGYRVWFHEKGVDEVDGQNVYPVDSYFTTADFSLISQAQGKLKSMRVAVMEPDFIQSGVMTVQMIGSANARAQEVVGNELAYPETAFTPEDQVVYFKEERRIMRFKFRSNVVGGNYQMGQCIMHVEEVDGTYLGASY